MIVGLTGGIGSGKSTAAGIFSYLGIPVYDADTASKKLIDTDRELQKKLATLIGSDIVRDGKIDRPLMASRIFKDEELLKQTNALIHPAVARNFEDWHKGKLNFPYVLREAAILFESGSYRDCDVVVVVTAPREMRIDRVMRRGNSTRDDVASRMAQQWPESEKVARADYVIQNDLQRSLIKQVLNIHEDLIRRTSAQSR